MSCQVYPRSLLIKLSTLMLLLLTAWLATPSPSFAAACQVPAVYATIQTAVDDPGCDKIKLAPGTYYEHLIIARSVKIVGSGDLESVIDGQRSGMNLMIQAGLEVRLNNLIIQNGQSGSGAGIYNDHSQLTLNHVVLNGNVAVPGSGTTGLGGGVYNDGGQVVINNSAVVNNTAIDRGGGVFNTGNLIIKNSYFMNNALSSGGGLYNSGDVVIRFSTFEGNTSAMAAHIMNAAGTIHSKSSLYTDVPATEGAIWNNGEFISRNDSFTNHQSMRREAFGGAIHSTGVLDLRNCLFENNRVPNNGGAVLNGGTATISQCTFFNNQADGNGGAIYNFGDLRLRKAAVVDNVAGEFGGGIANTSTLTINNVTFAGNQAADFADIWNSGNCTGCPS